MSSVSLISGRRSRTGARICAHLGDARGDLVVLRQQRRGQLLAEAKLDLRRLQLLRIEPRCSAAPSRRARPPSPLRRALLGLALRNRHADERHQPPSVAKGRNGSPGTTPSTNIISRHEQRSRVAAELA